MSDMPTKFCDGCKHWDRSGESLGGKHKCLGIPVDDRTNRDDNMAVIDADHWVNVFLWTDKYFHCANWEVPE